VSTAPQDVSSTKPEAYSPPLALNLLDGRSAKPQPVALQITGDSAQIRYKPSDEIALEIPLGEIHRQMRWPEATVRGARMIELTDKAPANWEGAQLHWPAAQDPAAFDVWAAQHVPPHANPSASFVVQAQQSWRGTLVAFGLLVSVLWGLYLYGLPIAARGITALVPTSVDEAIGRHALSQMDGRLMTPSKLPMEDQSRIRERFLASVKKQYPRDTPQIRLEFRKSEIGPNAFALPGGIMVITDELVRLVKDDEVVLGVLAHELGHITRRHGMRQLVQLSALQGVLTVAFGDYGSLITAAPLVLGSMAYSRAHEREADDESIVYMRTAGINPLVMVKFFQLAGSYRTPKKDKDGNDLPPSAEPSAEKPAKLPETKKTPLGFSIISSHPLDEERMDKFRKAAGG
jgi:Zn-dependent protease with chaperone function